jgi:hypothetical protein
MSLKTSKGENMKKQYSTVLLALIGFCGLSAGAQAQEEGRVVANIPYEFVAGGKAFPAGTYTIIRVNPVTQRTLEIYNNETLRDSALLHPISSDAAVDHAALSLERVGDTYYLSRVATPAGVYTLPTPKAATTVAKVKQHDGMSSAGTN